MLSRTHHPTPFHPLLDPDVAMTIIVRTPLTPSLVDWRIVAATPHAAHLYGYATPAALEGRFASPLHVLEDVQRLRIRATLWTMGLAAATESYDIRLIRQTGEIHRVALHVEQQEEAGELLWRCHLAPADPHAPFQPPPLPAVIPADSMHALFGQACLAEVDAMLRWQQRQGGPSASTLGQTLRQARRAQGLSLQQVAARVAALQGRNMTRQYVSAIERERRRPSALVLHALAQVLGLEPLSLIAQAGDAEVMLREYLQRWPDCATGLITLLLAADQQGFAAWERLARQIATLERLPQPSLSTPRGPGAIHSAARHARSLGVSRCLPPR